MKSQVANLAGIVFILCLSGIPCKANIPKYLSPLILSVLYSPIGGVFTQPCPGEFQSRIASRRMQISICAIPLI